ncbi:TPA: tail fiber assembly protein [Escherichia coli]|uniref:tail fiber assembly protein n=1 Tax=Morganella morganii TaxID=582 RepID=UPI0034D67665
MGETNYIFSAVLNGFLPLVWKNEKEAAGTWPDDAVEISYEDYLEFTTDAPKGKTLGSDKKGNPAWVDVPPLTHEQHVAIAESQKQALITEVNTETAMLRAKLALKRIKPDEEALLNDWLDYLDELEAVDASTAPNIIWPVKPVV